MGAGKGAEDRRKKGRREERRRGGRKNWGVGEAGPTHRGNPRPTRMRTLKALGGVAGKLPCPGGDLVLPRPVCPASPLFLEPLLSVLVSVSVFPAAGVWAAIPVGL